MKPLTLGALSIFRECPLKFKYGFVDGRPKEKIRLLDISAGLFYRLFRKWGRNIVEGGECNPEPFLRKIGSDMDLRAESSAELLADDYSPEALRVIVLESLKKTVAFICDWLQMHVLDAGRSVILSIGAKQGIRFKHEVPMIGRGKDGKCRVIRVRFGPAAPDALSDGTWASADLWVSRRFYSFDLSATILYLPWYELDVEFAPETDQIERWRLETELLCNMVQERIRTGKGFHPRSGAWCLDCGYRSICPVHGNSGKREMEPPLFMQPVIRAAYRYIDLGKAVRRFEMERSELKSYLMDWMNRKGTDRIRGLDGKALLVKRVRKQVPRKGSKARRRLEAILKDKGYNGRIVAVDIMRWIKKSGLTRGEAEAIRRLLERSDNLEVR